MHARRTPELVITGLAAFLLVGALVGLANTTGGGGPAEPGTIEIEGFAFAPEGVTIDAGASLTWTNLDGTAHTVTQNGVALLDSPDLDTDDTYEVTFDEPGTYEYFCRFHPAMRARVTVEG